MKPLRAGTYVFTKRISYKARGREARTGRVRVIFRIGAR
jgi:hypothetical protein